MIINHNSCIKLVPLVILIYDARSHIHQITIFSSNINPVVKRLGLQNDL